MYIYVHICVYTYVCDTYKCEYNRKSGDGSASLQLHRTFCQTSVVSHATTIILSGWHKTITFDRKVILSVHKPEIVQPGYT